MVADLVELLRQGEVTHGTGYYTQLTAFAELIIQYDLRHLLRFHAQSNLM